jgi:two-component system NarL family response regulator
MKFIIIEDNTMLRKNLALLLNGEAGLELCGDFGTAEEAIPAIKEIQPDMMLVDLGLPGMSGIDLIHAVKEEYPDIEVLVHTVFDARDKVFDAIKAGAAGYILKGASPRELIEAIDNLCKGGAPMSPKIARAVINEFHEKSIEEQYLLSPREKEILLELEKGLTYKDLGKKLYISPHTIHTHIKHIYEKLHAKSRKEALVTARRKGII